MDGCAPRIAIIDDDRAILLSHTIILERAGYSVTGAATVADALAILSNQKFDLLMCDLSLDDGKSGLEVIEAALAEDSSMAVILMTGYSDTELPARFAAVRLIAKPANVPNLLETIKTLLAQRRTATTSSD
jgi:DNA-binding NtrC family response regulator